jgi:hypothetical protein
MTVNRVLHELGDNIEFAANATNNEEQIGNVNAEGTVHAASSADIAFRLSYARTILNEISIYTAFTFHHLPESLFNLADR